MSYRPYQKYPYFDPHTHLRHYGFSELRHISKRNNQVINKDKETEENTTSTIKTNEKIALKNLAYTTEYYSTPHQGIEIIPSDIDYTKYVSLSVINLSNNQIKSIPIELFKLPSLQNLDLSNNYLETLPKNIVAIKGPFNYGLFPSKEFFKRNKDGFIDIPLTYLNINNNFLKDIPQWVFEIKDIKQILAKNNYSTIKRPTGTRISIHFVNNTYDKGVNRKYTTNVNGTGIEYVDSSDDEDETTTAIKKKQTSILQNTTSNDDKDTEDNKDNNKSEKISKNNKDYDMLKTYILYLQNENGILKERVKHQSTMIDMLLKQKNEYAAKVFDVNKSS